MRRNRRIARLCITTALASAGAGISCTSIAQTPLDLDDGLRDIDLTWTDEPGEDPSFPVEDTDAVQDDEQVDQVLFEADLVTREFDDGPIVAEGDVRAFFGERYLRADRLVYNPTTNIVVAEGNVSITDEDLETAFAGRVELSGDLRDGIAENFSALLENNTRLAAESAVREQGAKMRLNKAVYTACDVCNSEGEAKTPTWRIRSLRVVRDEERKVVRFHHAFLQMKGVPIMYLPFIQAPDPSVERQSGFLPPRIGGSSRLGFNVELPYYLAISNHQDATFFPKITSREGILWQGEWRRRGREGYHVLSGGILDIDNQTALEDNVPPVRWHAFARGYRDFGDNWRASYDFERISDNTYLRNYDVERRGDLRQELDRSDTNQLRSNARLAWNSGGSQLTMDTYWFQGLRSNDDASKTPFVLPLIDYRYDFGRKHLGGRSSIGANIASLQRTAGTDTRRFSANAEWERAFTTRSGHRFNLFAEARGDIYYLEDLDEGTEVCSNPLSACAADFPGLTSGDSSTVETRLAPTAAVEWSYPLARNFAGARLFLEPRVQFVASLANRNPAAIINEDSQSIEFDYAGLFDYNKATGFDAFEDGQRVNIGLKASAEWRNGLSVAGTIGQQFRLQETDAFDFSSGLGETTSDIVGSLDVSYGRIIGVENRFRLENKTGAIQRAESMAYLRVRRFSALASYVRLNEENIANNLVRREELNARGTLKITDNWMVGAGWRLDLEGNRTTQQDFSIGYEDECSSFRVTYRRDRTRQDSLTPDNAIVIRFSLKSLAE